MTEIYFFKMEKLLPLKRVFLYLILLIHPLLEVSAQDSIYFRANEWKDQLDAYYQEDSNKIPEKGQILFVGSSSFKMWKNIQSYFPGHKILNRGFGGSRMSDLLYHIQRLVIDYRPSQIVLYCGENDISNGVSPQDLSEDIKVFVRIIDLRLPGVPILILSIKPSPLLYKLITKQREANSLIREFAMTKNQVDYIDITTLMVDEKGIPIEELYLKDRLHISEKAYQLWARTIEPHLKKF